MLRPDDLNRGMYIAVTGDRSYPHDEDTPTPSFHGRPVEVLEVSLPFVAVNDGRKTFAMDIRGLEMVRVSRRYWREMTEGRGTGRRGKRRPERAELDPATCPHCGGRMVQILNMHSRGVWQLTCRQCGLQGGQVDVGTGY